MKTAEMIFERLGIDSQFDGNIHTWTNPEDGKTWTMEKPNGTNQEEWENQRYIDIIWTIMPMGNLKTFIMNELQREKKNDI